MPFSPLLKSGLGTFNFVAFSQSKKRAGYNAEEKFTIKTNSKTVPYKFHEYQCQMAGIFHR
jgi:hypothetical protein